MDSYFEKEIHRSDLFGETTSVASASPSSSGSYRRTMSSEKHNSSTIYCRICHEDESLEELVDPCKCAGTLGLIHASCLEKWLSTSNTDRCEICKYVFTIQRRKKSLRQSISQWWQSKSTHGPRGIAGDAICLTVLTPLCFAATYLCAIGASAYSRLGYWEGTGLAILCTLLVATYCLWLTITVRFHYKIWRRWRRQNQDVILLVKHKTDQQSSLDGVQSTQKSPRHRQDRNNNRDEYERSFPNQFMFGRPLNHQEDPTYAIHQNTSYV